MDFRSHLAPPGKSAYLKVNQPEENQNWDGERGKGTGKGSDSCHLTTTVPLYHLWGISLLRANKFPILLTLISIGCGALWTETVLMITIFLFFQLFQVFPIFTDLVEDNYSISYPATPSPKKIFLLWTHTLAYLASVCLNDTSCIADELLFNFLWVYDFFFFYKMLNSQRTTLSNIPSLLQVPNFLRNDWPSFLQIYVPKSKRSYFHYTNI